MIIDHIGLEVTDYPKSKAFYVQALAPLGIGIIMEVEGFVGIGREGKPEFWFSASSAAPRKIHVAFTAANRAQVRAFHEAALAAAGRDNVAPGIRALYHPNYYGAFVLDPDGNNIEAVCHTAE